MLLCFRGVGKSLAGGDPASLSPAPPAQPTAPLSSCSAFFPSTLGLQMQILSEATQAIEMSEAVGAQPLFPPWTVKKRKHCRRKN